jgi:hypothetical protein
VKFYERYIIHDKPFIKSALESLSKEVLEHTLSHLGFTPNGRSEAELIEEILTKGNQPAQNPPDLPPIGSEWHMLPGIANQPKTWTLIVTGYITDPKWILHPGIQCVVTTIEKSFPYSTVLTPDIRFWYKIMRSMF